MELDLATEEWSSMRPCVRSDVVCTPHRYRGKTYYHLEASDQGVFYRIGYAEYVFISLLDGKTSCAEALTLAVQHLQDHAPSRDETRRVVQWMHEHGLFEGITGNASLERVAANGRRGAIRDITPWSIRVRLLQPDHWLGALEASIGRIFSPGVMFLALLVGLCVFVHVLGEQARLSEATRAIASPWNWPALFASWILLKALHELGHGVVCKRYGGEVRELGVAIVFGVPLAYVDVTSGWRFPSKWQRIHVSLAGMYVEWLMATISGIVWCNTTSDELSHILLGFMISATVSTLLINGNPWMRFDGYFVLSDLLEIPNLYAESMESLQELVCQVMWGDSRRRARRTGHWELLLVAHGIAVVAWQIMMWSALGIVASTILDGAGLVVVCLALATWFRRPVRQSWQRACQAWREDPPALVRASLVALLASGGSVLLYQCIPNPWTIRAPGIVDFHELSVVRITSPGFVRRVFVSDGQAVRAGETLVVLENPDVSNELRDLELQMQQCLCRQRIARDTHRVSELQVELGIAEALTLKLAEKRRKHESLTIRASIDGQVVAAQLQNLVGTYFDEGEEILAICDDQRKELIVWIDHEQVDDAWRAIGNDVSVRVNERERIGGRLERIEPRASSQLSHAALAASEGGELAVRKTADSSGTPTLELVEPRFRGFVRLDAGAARKLSCGERGYAFLGRNSETVGASLVRRMRSWIRMRYRDQVIDDQV